MNSAKNDNLEPGLGTRNFVQSESQTLKAPRFEFCCTPSEKLIIVPDTDYITSAT